MTPPRRPDLGGAAPAVRVTISAPWRLAVLERVRRRFASIPGAARFGWLVFAFGLLWVLVGAANVIDPRNLTATPIAVRLAVLGVGFALVALGWRSARERRAVSVSRWAARLVNARGLASAWSLHGSLPAPPSRPRSPEHARVESRNAAFGVATGVAWLFSSLVAVGGIIRWFPPLPTIVVLSIGTPVVTAAGMIAGAWLVARSMSVRRIAVIALALLVPVAAVVAVPALGSLRTTPLPGRPDTAATASPRGPSQLFLVLDGGTKIIRLTDGGTAVGGADLSPDGHHVAFGDDRADTIDVWIMDLDGRSRPIGLKRLTDEPGDELFPKWSPDGLRIAFTHRTEDGTNVGVVDVNNGWTRDITADDNSRGPSWLSARSLLYSSGTTVLGTNPDIWEAGVDGSNPRLVLDSGGDDYAPIPSPDGRRLLFASNRTGNIDVWVADMDGRHARALTAGEEATDEPYGWSPDGRYVYFTSDRSSTGGNFLYFAPASGGPATLAVVL
jgi:hypothetical protein